MFCLEENVNDDPGIIQRSCHGLCRFAGFWAFGLSVLGGKSALDNASPQLLKYFSENCIVLDYTPLRSSRAQSSKCDVFVNRSGAESSEQN